VSRLPWPPRRFKRFRQRAKALGRTVKFSIRLNLIVRETKEEA
jgi:alkanesulfonate monooxygenase